MQSHSPAAVTSPAQCCSCLEKPTPVILILGSLGRAPRHRKPMGRGWAGLQPTIYRPKLTPTMDRRSHCPQIPGKGIVRIPGRDCKDPRKGLASHPVGSWLTCDLFTTVPRAMFPRGPLSPSFSTEYAHNYGADHSQVRTGKSLGSSGPGDVGGARLLLR